MALTSQFTVSHSVPFEEIDNIKTRRVGGASSLRCAFGGLVYSTAESQNVSTSETDFYNVTVPANALNTNDDLFEFEFFVFLAVNGNAKRYRIYVNGTVVLDTGSQTWNNHIFQGKIRIRRTSSSAVLVTGSALVINLTSGAYVTVVYAIAAVAVTLTSSWVFKSTGQGGASADVHEYNASLGWIPAGN